MFNVLVVDDEHNVCEGIRDVILGSALEVDEVYMAMNGHEALDYIRMERIDLVLTDIQMNGMSGIDLMEAVFLEHPGIPFVVISAHDEFSYAQKCMRLGAKDYIVKPISPEQLIEVVGKLLKNKRALNLELSLQRKYSLEGVYSTTSLLLGELLREDNGSDRNLEDVFVGLGLRLKGPYFSFVTVQVNFDEAMSFRDRNLIKYACMNVMEETIAEWDGYVFYSEGKLVTLLQWEEDQEYGTSRGASKVQMIGQLIHYNLQTYLHQDTTVGIGRVHRGKQWLRLAYSESGEALQRWRADRDHAVWYAGDIDSTQTQSSEWLQKLDEYAGWLERGLERAEVEVLVEKLCQSLDCAAWDQDRYASFLLLACSRIYGMMLEYKEELGDDIRQFDPGLRLSAPAESGKRPEELKSLFLRASEVWRRCMEGKDTTVIRQVVSYIQASYRDKGLNLQEIAASVYLSPNYVSYLFKKGMGMNLWDYVIQLRMEEARKLLTNTSKKRYEIAYEIGYESPEHFSRIFRRYFGVTPGEMRNARE